MILSDVFKDVINRMHPDTQKVGLGDEIQLLGVYSPVILTYAVTADATGGLAIPVPFNFEILSVMVQCRATSGSGSMQLKKGSTAITDAIACATDKANVRDGSIDDAQSTITTADTLSVWANGANDRALITIVGKRA